MIIIPIYIYINIIITRMEKFDIPVNLKYLFNMKF